MSGPAAWSGPLRWGTRAGGEARCRRMPRRARTRPAPTAGAGSLGLGVGSSAPLLRRVLPGLEMIETTAQLRPRRPDGRRELRRASAAGEAHEGPHTGPPIGRGGTDHEEPCGALVGSGPDVCLEGRFAKLERPAVELGQRRIGGIRPCRIGQVGHDLRAMASGAGGGKDVAVGEGLDNAGTWRERVGIAADPECRRWRRLRGVRLERDPESDSKCDPDDGERGETGGAQPMTPGRTPRWRGRLAGPCRFGHPQPTVPRGTAAGNAVGTTHPPPRESAADQVGWRWARSPWRSKMVSTSTGLPSPRIQCGVMVSNSAAWPAVTM